jgi:hypothetical protein
MGRLVALAASRISFNRDGSGRWSGVATDDETYRDVMELLADAALNGWAVSWLPGLEDSVYIDVVDCNVIQGFLDVTAIGDPFQQTIQLERRWDIEITFFANPT